MGTLTIAQSLRRIVDELNAIDMVAGAVLIGGNDSTIVALDIDARIVQHLWIVPERGALSAPIFSWWSMLTMPDSKLVGERELVARGPLSDEVRMYVYSEYARQLILQGRHSLLALQGEGGFDVLWRANRPIDAIRDLTPSTPKAMELALQLQGAYWLALQEAAPHYPHRVNVRGPVPIMLEDPDFGPGSELF